MLVSRWVGWRAIATAVVMFGLTALLSIEPARRSAVSRFPIAASSDRLDFWSSSFEQQALVDCGPHHALSLTSATCSDPHVVALVTSTANPGAMSMEERQAELFDEATRANAWLFGAIARHD